MNVMNHTLPADDQDPEGPHQEFMEDAETPTQVQRGFGGVRRVNNLPVIIAGAIVIGFAAVIAIVAAHRAALNAPKPAGAATQETTADKSNGTQAEQMAATISSHAPRGVVSPLGQPTDGGVGVINPGSGQVDDSAVSGNSQAANSEAPALQQERNRILVMKRTALEQAIRAPTSVPANFASGRNSVGGREGMLGASETGSVNASPEFAGTGAGDARGAGMQAALLDQINKTRSSMESQRTRALSSVRALSDRVNELSQDRGSEAANSSSFGILPNSSAAAGSYAGQSGVPTLPTMGGSGAANVHQTLLSDATGQFDTKDEDHWSLNQHMTVPRSKYELRAGAVIPAMLISGVSSELPGQIIAQLSENVYDTARGNYLLLPQGSKLIGEYSSNVGYGQGRLLVVWRRIVFPDAKALDIGTMPGADGAGYAGMKDQVNNHYVRLFAGAIMLSGIEAAVVKSQPQSGLSVYPTTSQALDQALGQQLGLTATQLIQRNMNIAPTLNIRPGYRLNVMVTKDMVFSKPYKVFDY